MSGPDVTGKRPTTTTRLLHPGLVTRRLSVHIPVQQLR